MCPPCGHDRGNLTRTVTILQEGPMGAGLSSAGQGLYSQLRGTEDPNARPGNLWDYAASYYIVLL